MKRKKKTQDIKKELDNIEELLIDIECEQSFMGCYDSVAIKDVEDTYEICVFVLKAFPIMAIIFAPVFWLYYMDRSGLEGFLFFYGIYGIGYLIIAFIALVEKGQLNRIQKKKEDYIKWKKTMYRPHYYDPNDWID